MIYDKSLELGRLRYGVSVAAQAPSLLEIVVPLRKPPPLSYSLEAATTAVYRQRPEHSRYLCWKLTRLGKHVRRQERKSKGAAHLASDVDMGNVSSDTGSTANIVEAERRNERVGLQQQRQRLANTAYCSRDTMSAPTIATAKEKRPEGH
jgi:hypothetical protein